MRFYASETITGVANSTVYGSGLTSTEAERKRITRVWIVTSARAGNYAELWIEKERIANVHDDVLSLNTDTPKFVLDVDIELEIGKTLKPAIRCGGTATNITVVYEYEVIT